MSETVELERIPRGSYAYQIRDPGKEYGLELDASATKLSLSRNFILREQAACLAEVLRHYAETGKLPDAPVTVDTSVWAKCGMAEPSDE